MKQLTILSGKGGTGKTTVSAAFIQLAKLQAFADCDVDAPNLHLIHHNKSEPIVERYFGYDKAFMDEALCVQCGKCEAHCKFDAIRNLKLDPYACEGCGVCEYVCPIVGSDGKKAIRLEKSSTGQTMLYASENEIFSTAELRMGSGASGKLVTQVRKNLYQHMKGSPFIVIDGSPGIGCPVIASVTGANWVLIVAEPTISGIHDMERIVDTALRFGAQAMVCVNKADTSPENTHNIIAYCEKKGIPMVGVIPFDRTVIHAVNLGMTISDFPESEAGKAVEQLWKAVYEEINKAL